MTKLQQQGYLIRWSVVCILIYLIYMILTNRQNMSYTNKRANDQSISRG